MGIKANLQVLNRWLHEPLTYSGVKTWVWGQPDFQGNHLLSRGATWISRRLHYVDRQQLQNIIPPLAREIRNRVLAREGIGVDEKEFLVVAALGVLRDVLCEEKIFSLSSRLAIRTGDPSFLCESVPHFMFRKMLSPIDIFNLPARLNHSPVLKNALPGWHFELVGTDLMLIAYQTATEPAQVAAQAPQVLAPEPAPKLDVKAAICQCLSEGSGHPMTVNDLVARLETFLHYSKDDLQLLSAEIGQLIGQHRIGLASDGKAAENDKYYLVSKEQVLVDRGSLFRIQGDPILRTQAAMKELLQQKKVYRVLVFDNQKVTMRYYLVRQMPAEEHWECILPNKSPWLESQLPFMKGEAMHLGRTYIPASQFDLLQAHLRLVVGVSKEGRVVVSNTPENRAAYLKEIEEYERVRLEGELVERFGSQASTYLQVIHGIANAIEKSQPKHLSYFKARKILQRMSRPTLAYAAMVADLPEEDWPKAYKDALPPGEAPAMKQRIAAAKRCQNQPFDARVRSGIVVQRTFLDTNQRYLEKIVPDVESLLLFFISDLSRAIYLPETLSEVDQEELRYLSGSLAGKHRYPRLAAQLKDLRLMYRSPSEFEQTVHVYQGLVGGKSRKVSDAELASAYKKNKGAIAKILGVKESELTFLYRGKSYDSTLRKSEEVDEHGQARGIQDARGIRVLVDLKDPTLAPHEVDRRATEVIKAAKKALIELLLVSHGIPVKEYDRSVPGGDANVKDSLEGGRDTNFKVLKIYGQIDTEMGAPIPIELMVQTRNSYRLAERYPDQSHELRAMREELGGQVFRPLPTDTLWRLSLERDDYLRALQDAYAGETYINVVNLVETSTGGGMAESSLELLMDSSRRVDVNNPDRFFFDLQAFPLRRNAKTGETQWITPEDVYCAYKSPNHNRRNFSELGGYKVFRIEVDKKGQRCLAEKKPAKDGSIILEDGDTVVFHKRTVDARRVVDPAVEANRYLPWMNRVKLSAAYPNTRFWAWEEGHKLGTPAYDEQARANTKATGWERIRRVIADETGRATRKGTAAVSIEEQTLIGKIATALGFDSDENLVLALGLRGNAPEEPLITETQLVEAAGEAWKTAGIHVDIVDGPVAGTQQIEIHMQDWVGMLHNLFFQGIFPIEKVVDFTAESNDADERIKVSLTMDEFGGKRFEKGALLARLQEFDAAHRKGVVATQQMSKLQNFVFVKLLVSPENRRWTKLAELLGYIQGFPGVFPDSISLGNSRLNEDGTITIMMPETLRDQQIALAAKGQVKGLFELLGKYGSIIN